MTPNEMPMRIAPAIALSSACCLRRRPATPGEASGVRARRSAVGRPAMPVDQLKPKTIAFSDHRKDPLADPGTGLIRFEDWARVQAAAEADAQPLSGLRRADAQRQSRRRGKPAKESFTCMWRRRASRVGKPPGGSTSRASPRSPSWSGSIRRSSIAPIAPSEPMPLKHPEAADLRHPGARVVRGRHARHLHPVALQVRGPAARRHHARQQAAGKQPPGRPTMSNSRASCGCVPPQERRHGQPDEADRPRHAGHRRARTEHLLGQPDHAVRPVRRRVPAAPGGRRTRRSRPRSWRSPSKSDVLDRKKEYEKVPVLRNLVPAQVLVGNSSFNTGNSISAGLPVYVRNRIKAIAAIIERE